VPTMCQHSMLNSIMVEMTEKLFSSWVFVSKFKIKALSLKDFKMTDHEDRESRMRMADDQKPLVYVCSHVFLVASNGITE
jgi:hypothetical protein